MALFRQDTKIEALKRTPLFEGLSHKHLTEVARLTEDLEVPAGSILCREGSEGHELFVIIEGHVGVTRGGHEVATLGPGEFFGEIALLEPVHRTATVTAQTPLRFFLISDAVLRGVLDTDPEIERTMLRTVARRLAVMSGDPTIA